MLRATLDKISPKLVINAAAQVNLDDCEKDSGNAYLINAKLVAILVDYRRVKNVKFCHISTDHLNGLAGTRSDTVCQIEYRPIHLI